VALNPGTPLEVVEPLLGELELVLVLAVNPGWGGQRFEHATVERAARVKELIRRSSRDILLGIDGGITGENIGNLAGRGIDLVVTGSAAFKGGRVAHTTREMLDALRGRSR
jgi:ribulose-phosphate 3-epimerase